MLRQTAHRLLPGPRSFLGAILLGALLLPACDTGGAPATSTPAAAPAGTAAATLPGNTPGAPGVTGTSPPAPATPTTADVLPTLTLGGAPASTATPGLLRIVQITDYQNTEGGFTVIGTVRNTGTTPATGIKVVATVKDAAGKTIGTAEDTFLTLVVTLPPNVAAPFAILIPTLQGNPAKVDIQTEATPPPTGSDNLYPAASGLTVEGAVLGSPSPSGAILTGRVKNGGTTPAATVRVLGVGYDAQNQVVDVGKGVATPELIPAGGTAPFQVKFRRAGITVARFETLAVGLVRK